MVYVRGWASFPRAAACSPRDVNARRARRRGCLSQLQAAGDALGAGPLKRWYVVTDRATVWIDQREDGLLVATGPAAKHPEPNSTALGRR